MEAVVRNHAGDGETAAYRTTAIRHVVRHSAIGDRVAVLGRIGNDVGAAAECAAHILGGRVLADLTVAHGKTLDDRARPVVAYVEPANSVAIERADQKRLFLAFVCHDLHAPVDFHTGVACAGNGRVSFVVNSSGDVNRVHSGRRCSVHGILNSAERAASRSGKPTLAIVLGIHIDVRSNKRQCKGR